MHELWDGPLEHVKVLLELLQAVVDLNGLDCVGLDGEKSDCVGLAWVQLK